MHSCESFSSLSKIQTFIALRHFDINILRAFETKNSQTCEQQQSLGPPKKCTEVLAFCWLFKQNQYFNQLMIQSTRFSEVSVYNTSLTVITFLFPQEPLELQSKSTFATKPGKSRPKSAKNFLWKNLQKKTKKKPGTRPLPHFPHQLQINFHFRKHFFRHPVFCFRLRFLPHLRFCFREVPEVSAAGNSFSTLQCCLKLNSKWIKFRQSEKCWILFTG